MTPSVLDSRRSPAGRRFAPIAELEVQAALPEFAAALPGASRYGYLCVRELAGPFGIADLVAMVGGLQRLDERLAADIPPLLNALDAAIVAFLYPGRSRDADQIASDVDRPASVVKQRVRGLVRMGAVRMKSSGWVRHPALAPCGQLHALEAKVSDWSRGAEQAAMYSAWADTASLVVRQLPADPSRCVAKAMTLGVGVVHEGVWKCRPRRREHSAARRSWATEHLVAAIQS